MQWLQSVFGGQSAGMTLLLLVLGLAIALVLLFWVFRKIAGNGQMRAGKNRQPRLSVTDAAAVDDKRRLVLVRRDDVEHLVMIGGASDILIEANISMAQPAIPTAQRDFRERAVEPAQQPDEKAPAAVAAPVAVAAATESTAGAQKPEPRETTDNPAPRMTSEELRERAAARASHSDAAPSDLGDQASMDPVDSQQREALHQSPGATHSERQITSPSVSPDPSTLETELNRELASSETDQSYETSTDEETHASADPGERRAPDIDVTRTTRTEDEQKRRSSSSGGGKEVEDEMQKLLDELANT